MFQIVIVKDERHDFSVIHHDYLVDQVHKLVINVPGHHRVFQVLESVVYMDPLFNADAFSLANNCALSWAVFNWVLSSLWINDLVFWMIAYVNNGLEFYSGIQKLTVVKLEDFLFLFLNFFLNHWFCGLSFIFFWGLLSYSMDLASVPYFGHLTSLR